MAQKLTKMRTIRREKQLKKTSLIATKKPSQKKTKLKMQMTLRIRRWRTKTKSKKKKGQQKLLRTKKKQRK